MTQRRAGPDPSPTRPRPPTRPSPARPRAAAPHLASRGGRGRAAAPRGHALSSRSRSLSRSPSAAASAALWGSYFAKNNKYPPAARRQPARPAPQHLTPLPGSASARVTPPRPPRAAAPPTARHCPLPPRPALGPAHRWAPPLGRRAPGPRCEPSPRRPARAGPAAAPVPAGVVRPRDDSRPR